MCLHSSSSHSAPGIKDGFIVPTAKQKLYLPVAFAKKGKCRAVSTQSWWSESG
jgi:hypothetical protein